MSAPAPETKDTAKKMTLGGVGKSLLGGAKKTGSLVKKLFSKEPTSELVVDEKLTPAEYLGEIFKMMKVMDEDKKLHHEMANNHLEEEQHKKDIRNKEIIQALTGKKFKKTKFKSKLKSKTKKKITAAKVSDSVGGGFSLGTLGTIAVGTAAVVGTGAVLMSAPKKAFANTMKLEQNVDVNDPKSAERKAKERALDRDKSYSYGVFGLSSIREGDKQSSLDSFIKENPQFKLSDPGNGGKNEKFYEEWNALDSKELLDAQEKWWLKHVYDPTVATLESSGIPSEISTDERVRAYMIDRANQTGDSDEAVKKTITKAGADKSTTAESFIDKMSDYDLANLDKKFGKYLKQFPENKKGLIKRIERRKKLSLDIKKETPKASAEPKKSPEITDEELEKQRLEYEKQAENGMDMGYRPKPLDNPVETKDSLKKGDQEELPAPPAVVKSNVFETNIGIPNLELYTDLVKQLWPPEKPLTEEQQEYLNKLKKYIEETQTALEEADRRHKYEAAPPEISPELTEKQKRDRLQAAEEERKKLAYQEEYELDRQEKKSQLEAQEAQSAAFWNKMKEQQLVYEEEDLLENIQAWMDRPLNPAVNANANQNNTTPEGKR